MQLGDARTPEGERIYAIGDIHGCDGHLVDLLGTIADDLRQAPADRHRIIYLGDYVDRGPEVAGVVERLCDLAKSDPASEFVRGNHEAVLLDFLDDPEELGPTFLAYGGLETLRSYGCNMGLVEDADAVAEEARQRIPSSHMDFFNATRLSLRYGDYFFCHAGIRPGVPLNEQAEDDLIWIREPFLESDADHGVVVVHGHTPASEPEVMANRINVDTGAVFGGPLTCAVLEATACRFLQAG